MNKQIEIIKKTRTYLLEQIKDLTAEQLNKIPDGFNNNIIWNLGHMVAAQQGICYMRSGNETIVGEAFFNNYKPGSKPEQFFDVAQYEKIKDLFTSTLTQLEADLAKGMFANYPAFTTRYGIELASIDDAIQFFTFS